MPPAPQLLIPDAASIAIECVILAAYGDLPGRARQLAREPRFVRTAHRVSGGIFVCGPTAVALGRER